MPDIILHKELGVNPRLSFCTRCGGETNEIAMLGNRNYKLKCQCGALMYGGVPKRRYNEPPAECEKCGARWEMAVRIELTPGEKVPARQYCDECKKEVAEHSEIVKAGGIFWRCAKCKSSGVIKPDAEICARVRKQMNVPTGPVGVEFADCPSCSPTAAAESESPEHP